MRTLIQRIRIAIMQYNVKATDFCPITDGIACP